MSPSKAVVLVALLAFGQPSTAFTQTRDDVLVVINDASAASIQVGEAYVHLRQIPTDQVVRLKAPTTESISRTDFQRTIEVPIAAWLTRHSLQDRILFIVLTKDVPLRISGTGGQDGTVASVDSELTLLYRSMVGIDTPLVGRVSNPYFLGERPIAEAAHFTRAESDIYLVTRLDGFSVDDALSLVERARAPSQTGAFVLDQRGNLFDRGGNSWLKNAADALAAAGAGDRVVLETTASLATSSTPAIGYYSFGSNDPAYRVRHPGLQFAPGAIGGMFVSTDGRTFIEPPADWVPGASQRPPGPFGNGSQSVVGDLIRAGLTGASAHVAEPYLDATVRPQILFPAYLRGFNLAESFYLAVPYLSWQTIILGDPLCAPFAPPQPRPATTTGIDPATDLPALFSARRVALATKAGLKAEGVRLALKAEVQAAAGNTTSSEALFKQATEAEPRLVSAHLQLAQIHQRRRELDLAIDRYRRVIDLAPQNSIALNNLAEILSIERGNPSEALPYAARAYKSLPSNATADTLGWIHHLLKDDLAARPYMEIVLASPGTTTMYVHAATVFAELKDWTKARAALDAAEKQDPAAKDRADVKALRAAIK